MSGSRFLRLAALFAFLFAPGRSSPAGSPASDVAAAVHDLDRVDPPRRPFTRYLSLVALSADERKELAAAVDFVAASVGSSPNISLSTPVDGGLFDAELLRIDLGILGIDPRAWEAMIAAGEPYYHIRTKVIDPRSGKEQVVYTDGGFVGLENAAKLRAATGTTGAVVRASWFVHHGSSDRYYLLSQTPATLWEWYKAFGADPKVISALAANHGANIFESGVTRKPRRLSRWQGPLGGVWNTYDSADTDNPLTDPFRVPGFGGEYDAGEFIAVKANGLLAYALYNSKGEIQQSVPDVIAKDTSDPAADGRLVPMQSCVRCHVDKGFHSFENDMRSILEDPRGGANLASSQIERLRSFYSTDKLSRGLGRDQEDYVSALAEVLAGRVEAAKWPAVFAAVVRRHAFERVTPERAAAELGVSSLRRLESSRDVYLLALASGRSIRRKAWEDSFHEAAVLTAGDR